MGEIPPDIPRSAHSKKAKTTLDKDYHALYIGSGASLQSLQHITALVTADVYILSDLLFNSNGEFYRFDDCLVITTNTNGFSFPTDNIRYVVIDQTAEGNWEKYFLTLARETFVHIHSIDDLPLDLFKAAGLVGISTNLYLKT